MTSARRHLGVCAALLVLVALPSCLRGSLSTQCEATRDCFAGEFCQESGSSVGTCAPLGCLRDQGAQCRAVCDVFGVRCASFERSAPRDDGFRNGAFAIDGEVLALWRTSASGAHEVLLTERRGDSWTTGERIAMDPHVPSLRRGTGPLRHALALNGDTLVVTSTVREGQAQRGGAFSVFERRDGSWIATHRSGWQDEDGFGTSVDVEGDAVFVSTPRARDPSTGGLACTVHVYERAQQSWVRSASMRAPLTASPRPGGCMAQDRGTLVVRGSEELRVFSKRTGPWAELGPRLPLSVSALDVSGSTLVVREEAAAAGASVRVVDLSPQGWGRTVELVPTGVDEQDGFGFALAIEADTVVVGAPGDDSGSSGFNGEQFDGSLPDSGAVYFFGRRQDVWAQTGYLKSARPDEAEGFGADVEASGSSVVVGVSERTEEGAPEQLSVFQVAR